MDEEEGHEEAGRRYEHYTKRTQGGVERKGAVKNIRSENKSKKRKVNKERGGNKRTKVVGGRRELKEESENIRVYE